MCAVLRGGVAVAREVEGRALGEEEGGLSIETFHCRSQCLARSVQVLASAAHEGTKLAP